jgi:hypothetical protein
MQHTDTHDWRIDGAQFPELIEGALCEAAPDSGAQLAGEMAIAESTLRTRWLTWLERVAPMELMRTAAGDTDLARSLALEFKQVPSKNNLEIILLTLK